MKLLAVPVYPQDPFGELRMAQDRQNVLLHYGAETQTLRLLRRAMRCAIDDARTQFRQTCENADDFRDGRYPFGGKNLHEVLCLLPALDAREDGRNRFRTIPGVDIVTHRVEGDVDVEGDASMHMLREAGEKALGFPQILAFSVEVTDASNHCGNGGVLLSPRREQLFLL
jgi:hypothetical protein